MVAAAAASLLAWVLVAGSVRADPQVDAPGVPPVEILQPDVHVVRYNSRTWRDCAPPGSIRNLFGRFRHGCCTSFASIRLRSSPLPSWRIVYPRGTETLASGPRGYAASVLQLCHRIVSSLWWARHWRLSEVDQQLLLFRGVGSAHWFSRWPPVGSNQQQRRLWTEQLPLDDASRQFQQPAIDANAYSIWGDEERCRMGAGPALPGLLQHIEITHK